MCAALLSPKKATDSSTRAPKSFPRHAGLRAVSRGCFAQTILALSLSFYNHRLSVTTWKSDLSFSNEDLDGFLLVGKCPLGKSQDP